MYIYSTVCLKNCILKNRIKFTEQWHNAHYYLEKYVITHQVKLKHNKNNR